MLVSPVSGWNVSVRHLHSQRMSAKENFPSSPVPHLLFTNVEPSDTESKLIYDILKKTRQRLDALEGTKAVIADSRLTGGIRDQLKEFHDSHKVLLSGVRRLPVEIIEIIFLHYRSTATDPAYPHALPWEISQICHSWREVALSMPVLWSRVPVISFGKDYTTQPPYLEFLRELLRRTRNSNTLDISLYWPRRASITAHPAVEILARHSHRWRSLWLRGYWGITPHFSSIRGNLDSLQSLDLDLIDEPFTTSAHLRGHHTDIFLAPELRHLSITGFFPTQLEVPWSQLTEYREHTHAHNHGSRVPLALSSPLRKLTIIRDENYEVPILSNLGPNTFGNLTDLEIKFGPNTSNAPTFLDKLLPQLSSIEVLKIMYHTTGLIPLLSDRLTRHARTQPCPLRKLAIYGGNGTIQAGDLSSLLSLTPHLVELDIPIPTVSDLRALRSDQDEPPLVPELQSLILQTSSDLAYFQPIRSELIQLAESRCSKSDEGSVLDTILPWETRELTTLRLSFLTLEKAHTAQTWLNQWEVFDQHRPIERDTLSLLKRWRYNFHGLLPEVQDGFLPNLKTGLPVPRILPQLNLLFREMEEFEMVDGVTLHQSRLPLTLERFEQRLARTTQFTQNDYHFLQRSRDLLVKWEPLLLEESLKYSWVVVGSRSLKYIPGDAPVRYSGGAARLVYGLEENMDIRDVFWTTYM